MSVRALVVGLPLVLFIGCTAKEQKAAGTAASSKPVVEAYVDAWNRHDSAAFDSLMAPDGTHEDVALGFIGKGPGGVKQFLSAVLSMEPDFAWKITNVVEQGPMVAAQWTWTATYTGPDPEGRPVKDLHVSGRGTAVVEVENGKIKKLTDYYDNASFFPKPDTTKKKTD
jgi:steroid delta-isomerase-like uncharacterized protein